MYLLLISLVLCFLLLWLYKRWSKVKKYWSDRGVRHYSPNPFLGSLTFLQRENPALWMRKVYKEFNAPYVGMWLFWRPALVINCPEIAKRILVKDSDIFRNRFLSSGKTDPIGALNLFTVNDPIWSKLRRRLTVVFTGSKLKSHNHITQTKSKDLLLRINNENAKNKHLNLRTFCLDYTTDVIGESAFGLHSESTKTGDSYLRKLTREIMAFNLIRGLSWSSIFFFPELVDVFRFKFFPEKSMQKMREIFRRIVQQRGGYDEEIKEAKDLMDVLLKIKQDAAAENEEMSENLLLSQAAIFLLGGFDSSGSVMSYTMYFLAWNPHCQEKLYEQLLEAKQKVGDKEFDATTLAEIHYLNAVIKESLRIFPPLGWLDRIADKDYQIDENLTIHAGTVVYINAAGMQIDPQYYPDPLVFDPDRFLPENEISNTPYTYMPFGEGPRNCIGTRFGYQTLRQGISSIIMNYKMRPLPGTPQPIDISVETNGMFLMPLDEKMIVKFVPRQKA